MPDTGPGLKTLQIVRGLLACLWFFGIIAAISLHMKLDKSEDLKAYNQSGEATITSNLVSLEEGFQHSLTV
jgi:hypothetical protein